MKTKEMYKKADEIAAMEDGRSKVVAAAQAICDITDDIFDALFVGTLPSGAVDVIYILAQVILEQEAQDVKGGRDV